MPHALQPKTSRPARRALFALVLLIVVGLVWFGIVRWRAGRLVMEDDSVISALVMSEETYLALGPDMARLSADFAGLMLPGPRSLGRW